MSDSNATSTNGESTVTQNTDAFHPTSDTPVCIDNPFKPVQTPFTMKTKPDGPEVERTITDYAKVTEILELFARWLLGYRKIPKISPPENKPLRK